MTTFATKLERDSEEFSAYTSGTGAFLAGLKISDCPHPARTLRADCWELGFGRASQSKEAANTNTGSSKFSEESKEFIGKLFRSQIDLSPEIAEAVNEHFWELL